MEKNQEIIDILKEIKKNTNPKSGFDIILTGNKTELVSSFSPSIHIKGNYGLALDHISTYNSIMNVNSENNKLEYYNGTGWISIELGVGSYEIDEINNEIKRIMETNGDFDSVNDSAYIEITANNSRLTSNIEIKKKEYKLDLGSLGPLLGFTNKVILEMGYHESPSPVYIISVNSVIVNCDIIESTYMNGKKSNSIYSFPINVSPGFRLTSHPTTLQYHRIVVDELHTIKVWLTDDFGKLLDLRGELLTIRLRIQEL